MSTSTTIRLRNDNPFPSGIPGVAVEFYDAETGLFVTSGTSDSGGEVTVLLPDGTYNVLFYKPGVSILPRQPQQIVVSALATSNTFLVIGHVRTMPESPDSLRCRISGFLVGQDNLPATDIHVSFQSKPDVSSIGGNLISPQQIMRVQPDSSGYFQFDLIRGQKYSAFLRYIDQFPQLNISPAQLDVIVPNLPALSLLNLLFPLPIQTTFSAGSISIPLSAGPDSSVDADTMYSDGNLRNLPTPWATLLYDISDPSVLEAAILGGRLILTPLKTGTSTVSLHRVFGVSIFWPDAPSYQADSIEVTVT